MDTKTNTFDDIDPKTESNATNGVSARRKAWLTDCAVPYSTLQANGVDVPHREYADGPEDVRDYPTTVTFDDGSRVHLHQDVREVSEDDAFGDFAAVDEDTEDVVWTVVDLCDGTVTLTVVGDWGQRRDVPVEAFPDEYEPLHLADGQPRWGY